MTFRNNNINNEYFTYVSIKNDYNYANKKQYIYSD